MLPVAFVAFDIPLGGQPSIFSLILLLDTRSFPSGASYGAGISSLAHGTWFTHARAFEDLIFEVEKLHFVRRGLSK